jgi:hypothetical protein
MVGAGSPKSKPPQADKQKPSLQVSPHVDVVPANLTAALKER